MPTPRTLTLATQSLRGHARATAPWLARTALAAVAVFALFLAWSSRGMFGAPGQRLFAWHAWACFWLLALGGTAFFPAAIAEEKEQRTLPLLRLAGCSPAAILLGRSAGDLLIVGTLLLAQLPIAMLAIPLGGVAPIQVGAAGVLLLAFTLFVHGAGLLCAVLCASAARATTATAVLVAAALVAPSVVGRWVLAIRPLCAVGALDTILETGFAGPLLTWAAQAHAALGLALALAAWVVFRSQTDDGAGTAATVHRPAPANPGVFAAAVWSRDRQHLHGGGLGVVWRLAAQLGAQLAAAIVASTLVPMPRGASFLGGLWQGWAVGGLSVVVLDLGISAARAFGEDLRCRTFAQIGTLPMSTEDHVNARWSAYWETQMPGLLLLFVVAMVDLGPFGLIFGGVLLMPQLLLLPYVTAWLTLQGWRGAFALALVAQLVCCLVVWCLFAGPFSPGLGCLGVIAAVTLPLLLQIALRRRIRARFGQLLAG